MYTYVPDTVDTVLMSIFNISNNFPRIGINKWIEFVIILSQASTYVKRKY